MDCTLRMQNVQGTLPFVIEFNELKYWKSLTIQLKIEEEKTCKWTFFFFA